jgi:hypothetical protein
MKKSNLRFTLLIGSLTSFFCSLGMAYVPPAEYQIQQLVKKHVNAKNVRVRSRLTNGTQNLKETLWYDASTRILRGKITDESDELVYSYQKKLFENGVTASSLMFETSAASFLKQLSNEGVALEEKLENEPPLNQNLSLGRVKNQMGWVIGSGTPSLWILKDEFHPLKWVPKNNSNSTEILFEETKFQRDFPYSRLITITESGKEVLRLEAIEITLNADLSDIKNSSLKIEESPRLKLIQDLLQWIR